MPEIAIDFPVLDLQIRNRCFKFRIPINKTFVAIDEALLIEFHKNLTHRLGQSLIHSEPLAGPIAGRAEATQLAGYRAAGFFLPRPDFFQKFFATHFPPPGFLALHHLPLNHHLCGDTCMVRAHLP